MADTDLKIRIGAQDQASSVINRVSGAIKGLVLSYMGFLTVRGAVDFLKDATKEAMEQENAIIKLTSALKQQGSYTDDTMKSLIAFATAMQNTTKYTDEAVLETQALLTRIGVAPEYLNNATKSAMDFSSSLGIDLHSAAMAVGKAYEGNLMLLQRYGIQIDTAKLQSEGFSYVLDEMQKKFGGASEAMGATFQGQLTIIGNLFTEIKEKIGGAIVNSAAWKETLKFVSEQLQILNGWLEENRGQIQRWSYETLQNLINFATFITDTFFDLQAVIASVAIAFLELHKVSSYLRFGGKAEREEINQTIESLMDWGTNAEILKEKIRGFAEMLDTRVRDAYFRHSETIVNEVIPAVEEVSRKVHKATQDMGGAFQSMKKSTNDMTEEVKNFGHEFIMNFIDNIIWAQGEMKDLGAIIKDLFKMAFQFFLKLAIGKILPFGEGGSVGYQGGGMVGGGAPYRDRIPAMLTPGEFVMPKMAVERIGVGNLERMRAGAGGSSFNISVNLNSSGRADYDAYLLANKLADEIKNLERRRMI